LRQAFFSLKRQAAAGVDGQTWHAYAEDLEANLRDLQGRLIAGTYEGHDVDIDGLNARFLAAMQGQPWEVAWVQANAGRSRMLQVLVELREPSDEAAWWIRKSGCDHYAEHLPRLREWVAELLARRTT